MAALLAALALPSAADEMFRVRIPASQHAMSVRHALKNAHARLAQPECQQIFRDFNDQAGRPLQDRLDTLGLSGQQFLTYIAFHEGYGERRCARESVMAFTQPGSLVVRVCPRLARLDSKTAEIILLHEMLHSLGLGENPPSTYEITDQVRKRCGGPEALSVRAAEATR